MNTATFTINYTHCLIEDYASRIAALLSTCENIALFNMIDLEAGMDDQELVEAYDEYMDDLYNNAPCDEYDATPSAQDIINTLMN